MYSALCFSTRSSRFMLLVILLLFAVTLTAQTTPQDFSIVLLPDTQFYSELHPLIFEQQTKWIVDNRAKWNIQAVLGEGDIVRDCHVPKTRVTVRTAAATSTSPASTIVVVPGPTCCS